jgi:hypothetical protein
MIRVEHNLGHVGNGLSVFLQQVVSPPSPVYSRLAFVDPATFAAYQDGQPHSVRIAWNLGVNPAAIKIFIDNQEMVVQQSRIIGDTGTLTMNYSAYPAYWGIGVDVFDRIANYKGALGNLTCYVSNVDETQRDNPIFCAPQLIELPGTTEGSSDMYLLPGSCPSPFAHSTDVPTLVDPSFVAPTHDQLSLAGGPTHFPVNWGWGASMGVPDPFGINDVFSVTGRLT